MEAFVKTRSVWGSKWIVFILILAAFGVRLARIEQPFVDPWSWRQCDVAAIARNFSENGFRFGHPQIDWAGDAPGYVGTEFPILPFLAALCYRITGVQDWIGRMESVVFFVAGLPFFLLLVRRLYGERVAVWATFFYAFAPLSLVASRSFIPDAPSLSLAIMGLYFFVVWLEEGGGGAIVAAALFLSLVFLTKITIAVIAPVIAYLILVRSRENAFRSEKLATRFRELCIFAVIVVVPSAVWYWHAWHISKIDYPYHFFGEGGFRIMNANWYWKIATETALLGLTPILFVFAVIGAFVPGSGKYKWAFHWWLVSMVVFIFFAGWGNRHPWYQLPLVPVAAVFAGCFCQWTATRLRWHPVVLMVVFVLVVLTFIISSYHASFPFYQPTSAASRILGLELEKATTSNALIIAVDNGNPAVFYYAHRKGWHFTKDGLYQGSPASSVSAISDLKKLRSRGATHLVFTSQTRWWLTHYRDFADYLATNATLVEEKPEFIIYKL